MELFTLRLKAPLAWTAAPVTSADEALDTASSDPGTLNLPAGFDTPGFVLPVPTQEGSEAVCIWTREQVVTDTDDGPRICLPLPPPVQTGISGSSADTAGQTSTIELPAGSYLFCQSRLEDLASVEQTLEWFFRETWWTRAECGGPVYLRLIREDGKAAVQVIMAATKQE